MNDDIARRLVDKLDTIAEKINTMNQTLGTLNDILGNMPQQKQQTLGMRPKRKGKPFLAPRQGEGIGLIRGLMNASKKRKRQ